MNCTDEIGEFFYVVTFHVVLYAFGDLHGGVGIEEIGGAYGYSGCSGEDEFQGIFGGGNTSHTDDGNIYALGHLIDHADGHGLDRRAGHAAGFVGQGKGLAFYVDLHAGQGIDQGYSICAAGFCCPGHYGNIRNVWAKLHDYRLSCHFFDLTGDGFYGFWILSEGDTAFLNIRAGNIDLQKIHRFTGQALYYTQVFFGRMAADIDHDLGIMLF